ncbi:MAG: AGE family epimerase/isomerase, partial [Spirochaetes bacterium]|nr:AGE family epimerase/isomerase [Spirochaetota bacterium]
YGGFFWKTDSLGNPLDKRKKTYGLAFAVYAISEYYHISKEPLSLKIALETFQLIEKKTTDQNHPGYFEVFDQKWQRIESAALSEVDQNADKSMNTHLHLLEAYTTLYQVTGDEQIYKQLLQLFYLLTEKILNPQNHHLQLFFKDNWQPVSCGISFGHEIETAWLLYEAAGVTGESKLINQAGDLALQIADQTFQSALKGENGVRGVINEVNEAGQLDDDRIWWVQAEACVGFMLAYQLSYKEKYLQAVCSIWKFIEQKMVDHQRGEWYWKITHQDQPDHRFYKAGEWKSLYHNTRACIELLTRIKNLTNKE